MYVYIYIYVYWSFLTWPCIPLAITKKRTSGPGALVGLAHQVAIDDTSQVHDFIAPGVAPGIRDERLPGRIMAEINRHGDMKNWLNRIM